MKVTTEVGSVVTRGGIQRGEYPSIHEHPRVHSLRLDERGKRHHAAGTEFPTEYRALLRGDAREKVPVAFAR